MTMSNNQTATRLCERALVRVTGADPAEATDFLQGLVTNDVTGPLPVWAGLLSAQGKVLFDFFVWPTPGGMLLDCEAAHAEDLVKRLSIYRLRRKLEIVVADDLAVHWSRVFAEDGIADPRLPQIGGRWLAPAGDDAQRCADGAYRAHRLALGVTEGRNELGFDQTLWLECNAAELQGVSFAKGCYIGQENTARMNWRQKVNRRLTVVPFDRSDPSRQRIAYGEIGYAVDHLRVADADPALFPAWLDIAWAPDAAGKES